MILKYSTATPASQSRSRLAEKSANKLRQDYNGRKASSFTAVDGATYHAHIAQAA